LVITDTIDECPDSSAAEFKFDRATRYRYIIPGVLIQNECTVGCYFKRQCVTLPPKVGECGWNDVARTVIAGGKRQQYGEKDGGN